MHERLRELLKPVADWSRLEELHGSTIGHVDIPDDEPAILVVGDLRTHVGTAGDLRALAREYWQATGED